MQELPTEMAGDFLGREGLGVGEGGWAMTAPTHGGWT